MLRSIVMSLLASIAALAPAFASAPASPELRLYVLDCGRAEFADLGPFSDTGEYDGHAATLMTPCFLVRHPRGDLLWEAGLGDKYAANPAGVALANYRAIVRKTLESQLREIGIAFSDIEFFAFSHGHADHLGNSDKLSAVSWIVSSKELEWLQRTPSPPRTNAALLAPRNVEKTVAIDGDYDVFGDKSVRIVSAPGHTPGHQVLFVTLRRYGTVVLSGDLYHSIENREGRRMPIFNTSRADTLASMDRIERLIRNTRAQLIIQHSVADFDSVPHIPEFLN